MRVVLVEADGTARKALTARLAGLGIEVASFHDPLVAFLFLLGHLREVDGVLVNSDDDPRQSRLLRWLQMLPAPLGVVTYSGRDPERRAARVVTLGAGGRELHPLLRNGADGREGPMTRFWQQVLRPRGTGSPSA